MMKRAAIEKEAFALLRDIWRAKERLWPDGVPRPVDMIEPRVAAHMLGMHYVERDELRGVGAFNAGYEIAGQIDRQRGEIAVSKRFPAQVMRFTGGHELGHAILHPKDAVLHRDPPINGIRGRAETRDSREIEADFFAACFLMPAGLVTQKLEDTFGMAAPFRINDTTAFLLAPNNQADIMSAPPASLIQESAIASASSFGPGGRFVSLADQFRVSVKTMAIRLHELNLVA